VLAGLLAFALALLPGCAAPAASPPRLLPLANPRLPLPIGELVLESAFEIHGGGAMGGLSGLLVQDDELVLLSDRGTLWRARIVESSSGQLVDLVDWRTTRLRRADGRSGLDTEDLARLPDGALAVALEDPRPLMRLEPGGVLTPLPFPRPLREAPPNLGVEALVDLPGGGLLLLTEAQPGPLPGTVAAGVQRGEESRLLAYRPAAGFSPTGADRLGPRLFVLERNASLLGGFEARIVLVDGRDVTFRAGEMIEGRELARLGVDTVSENFEGIAVKAASDGSVLLYLVSDDNFSALQRTLLLQFRYHQPP
jgi:hypothetical protein